MSLAGLRTRAPHVTHDGAPRKLSFGDSDPDPMAAATPPMSFDTNEEDACQRL
jgi:hypothetical protein